MKKLVFTLEYGDRLERCCYCGKINKIRFELGDRPICKNCVEVAKSRGAGIEVMPGTEQLAVNFQQRQELFKIFAIQGLSQNEISQRMGISRIAVLRQAKALGLNIRIEPEVRAPQTAIALEERKRQIKELALQGLSQTQIAIQLQLCKSTVLKYFRLIGIPPRSRSVGKNLEENQQVG